MGAHRDTLLELIRHALASSKADIVDLLSAVPDPRALDRIEKAAWIELSFWGDNAALRASDQRMERWSTERLKHLLACLQMRFFDYPV